MMTSLHLRNNKQNLGDVDKGKRDEDKFRLSRELSRWASSQHLHSLTLRGCKSKTQQCAERAIEPACHLCKGYFLGFVKKNRACASTEEAEAPLTTVLTAEARARNNRRSVHFLGKFCREDAPIESPPFTPTGAAPSPLGEGRIQVNPKTSRKYLHCVSLSHVVEQLCLLDGEMLCNIRWEELESTAWLKVKLKDSEAPNIMSMIRLSNRLGNLVISGVVYTNRLSCRAKVLSYYIDLALKLWNHGNCNSARIIVASLQDQAVYRLRQAWSCVSNKRMRSFEFLQAFFDPVRNSMTYPEFLESRLANCKPLIPFLGTFLTRLVGLNSAIQLHQQGSLVHSLAARVGDPDNHNITVSGPCLTPQPPPPPLPFRSDSLRSASSSQPSQQLFSPQRDSDQSLGSLHMTKNLDDDGASELFLPETSLPLFILSASTSLCSTDAMKRLPLIDPSADPDNDRTASDYGSSMRHVSGAPVEMSFTAPPSDDDSSVDPILDDSSSLCLVESTDHLDPSDYAIRLTSSSRPSRIPSPPLMARPITTVSASALVGHLTSSASSISPPTIEDDRGSCSFTPGPPTPPRAGRPAGSSPRSVAVPIVPVTGVKKQTDGGLSVPRHHQRSSSEGSFSNNSDKKKKSSSSKTINTAGVTDTAAAAAVTEVDLLLPYKNTSSSCRGNVKRIEFFFRVPFSRRSKSHSKRLSKDSLKATDLRTTEWHIYSQKINTLCSLTHPDDGPLLLPKRKQPSPEAMFLDLKAEFLSYKVSCGRYSSFQVCRELKGFLCDVEMIPEKELYSASLLVEPPAQT